MDDQKEVGPHWKFENVLIVWQLEDGVLYLPSDIAKLRFDPKKHPIQYKRMKNALTKRAGYNNILTDNPDNVDEHGALKGRFKMWFGSTWKTLLRDKDLQRLHAHLEEQERRAVSVVQDDFWESSWLSAFPWLNRPLIARLLANPGWSRFDRDRQRLFETKKTVNKVVHLPARQVSFKRIGDTNPITDGGYYWMSRFWLPLAVAAVLVLMYPLAKMISDDHSRLIETQREDHSLNRIVVDDHSARPVLDPARHLPLSGEPRDMTSESKDNPFFFKHIAPAPPHM